MGSDICLVPNFRYKTSYIEPFSPNQPKYASPPMLKGFKYFNLGKDSAHFPVGTP